MITVFKTYGIKAPDVSHCTALERLYLENNPHLDPSIPTKSSDATISYLREKYAQERSATIMQSLVRGFLVKRQHLNEACDAIYNIPYKDTLLYNEAASGKGAAMLNGNQQYPIPTLRKSLN